MEGEAAYKRLSQAKELDTMVNTSRTAAQSTAINLSSEMHEAYLREIVETGGAPSLQELSNRAEALGGLGLNEESVVKNSLNGLLNYIDSVVPLAEQRDLRKLTVDPKKVSVSQI